MEKAIAEKIHIISHTHWDREWFLAANYTREWLPPFFNSLFALLEREPQSKFVLDGQLVMVEDYLQLLQESGLDTEEPKQKLRRFAHNGQLILGPYYLQPDWQLISEESAVRNLLAGARLAREYGPIQSMGWLLDCFGQIAQTSQLHAGFGLKGIFVWRGVALEPEQVQTEFLWQSPDGTKLPTSYLLDSYRNAMRLCWQTEITEGRIRYIAEKLRPYLSSRNVLFMNGYDQEMEPEAIAPLLRQYPNLPLYISNPEDYMNAVLAEQPELLTLYGALYSGRYISVFPGILSARMPIKQRNYFNEKRLERYVEPLAALAEIWAGIPFPLEHLQATWQTVMKNHPHDTICGVSVDSLYRDLELRCNQVDRGNEESVKRSLAALLSLAENKAHASLHVYNPSAFSGSAVVEVPRALISSAECNQFGQIVYSDSKLYPFVPNTSQGDTVLLVVPPIPAMGLAQLKPQGVAPEQAVRVHKVGERIVLSNGLVEITIKEDGRLDLKELQNNIEFSGLHYLEDGADAGDTYNYSTCEQDTIISSKGMTTNRTILEDGPLRAQVLVALELAIPARLDSDRKARCEDKQTMAIRTIVCLETQSRQVKLRTELRNTARDHRLRVCFPTGLQTALSHAETQFSVTEHEIEPEPYSDASLSPELKKILLGAREPRPVSCFPQRQFVDLSDGTKGLAVLNKGLPEYEVLPEQRTIALTLFRSVGWLARTDLLERIGDAGPFIATPRAQLLQDMSFEYALFPHPADWEQGQVLEESESFNYPLLVTPSAIMEDIAVETGLAQGLFATPLPPQIKLSAFKKSEDDQAFIVRLCNYSCHATLCKFSFAIPVTELYEVPLAEQVIMPYSAGQATHTITKHHPYHVSLQFGRFEIKTLRFSCLPIEPPIEYKSNSPSISPLFWQEINPSTLPFQMESDADITREPLVTIAEVESEEQRCRDLAQQINQLRSKLQLSDLQARDIQMELYTVERAFYEAQISAIYLRESLVNPNATEDSPEIKSKMREIGLELNRARVNKRAFEYVHQFYQLYDNPS